MIQKTFLYKLGIVVLIISYSCKGDEKKIVTEKKPNFLFVLVDDQSPFDLEVYDGASILETPAINQLANEGTVFDGAYNMGSMNGAVCTPSRHMIMTGRTVWHLPPSAEFQDNTAPNPLDEQTIGAIFNRAGYKTMRTCKVGNSYPGANKQFTVVHDATKRGGTEESGSAWHSKQVLDYLATREEEKETNPFFIYFGFSHPHDTRNGTPKLLTKYGATNHKDETTLPPANVKQPELQENYLAKHPFFHGHPELRDEERVSGVWKNREEQTVRNELGREYACDENIDNQLQKVLARLKKTGELENTYVIYTSDHGMSIGRHGLMGKQNLYEHTWRVPFMIKGPGITANKRVQGNIYLLDVLPTLCDLAGIEIPETVEGKSFVPVLKGEKETVRDVMYGVYAGGTKPGMRSVKKGDWKLIKYDVMDGAVRETQLFNLKANPNEYLPEHQKIGAMETDLAENPEYSDKLAEMEQLLLEQMIENEDPYRLWNQTGALTVVNDK
ncbi:sulfatase-like hydrolase/transferase [Cellulophaga sp. HaHaR_3_176]|uniref:sulfatase-like hydrolase/transferase n=1 Tax=Cellulophaga sp. HaHaR_3_176 TaxID=1942464 RepID=UPI001C1FAF5F|nr:sulfatase-like hydrolase/transferase [Cellulophaga sp. HaHaR_3_176]QWX84987.1 sulfatase-like hydrolase/transferase [Cellulophaga sp. HaHaR_3_176]